MQIHWEGYYLDGRTAARRRVAIHMTPAGLEVVTDQGAVLWPYAEIRQTQGFYAGEEVRLERGGEIAETLLISDSAFLATLRRFAPALTTHLHDPSRRALRIQLTILAALAVVLITAALYLWGIPALAGQVAARVPVSWEEHLGQVVINHLVAPEDRCRGEKQMQAIQSLVATLLHPVPQQPYKFEVIVVDSPIVNALAAPGGQIVIFSGLLERTRSAEELAGVLAHELQHVLKRHSTRAILQHASTGLLVAAVTGDITGVTAFGLESARTLGMLRYSRKHEEEADIEGMRMLVEAGVDPGGMISVYEMFKKQGGELPAVLAYLATHPSTENRVERLKSIAAESKIEPARLLPGYNWSEIVTICPAAPRSTGPKQR